MRATFRRFLRDEFGATAIEYGLIAALISMAILAGVGSTADGVASLWNNNANKLVEAMDN